MISYKEFALVNKGGESFVWDRFFIAVESVSII